MEWHPQRSGGGRATPTPATILQGEEFACAFCKGTGAVVKTHGRCPVCGGQGSVRVTPPAVLCAYCGGRGEVPVRSGITCIVCRGKGAVSVKEPIDACPACRGRGYSGGGKLPCTTCQGKGAVTVRQGVR